MNLAVTGDQKLKMKKPITTKDKPLTGFSAAWPWPVLHDGGFGISHEKWARLLGVGGEGA